MGGEEEDHYNLKLAQGFLDKRSKARLLQSLVWCDTHGKDQGQGKRLKGILKREKSGWGTNHLSLEGFTITLTN